MNIEELIKALEAKRDWVEEDGGDAEFINVLAIDNVGRGYRIVDVELAHNGFVRLDLMLIL